MSKPAAAKKRRFSTSAIVASVMVAGAGCIAWYGLASAGPSQAGATARPQSITMSAPGPQAADAGSALESVAGGLPTRIVAAAAGIDAPINEVGIVSDNGKPAWETAWRGVGHHLDSARPGQPGNVVLTGHVSVADSRNLAAFKSLDRLNVGDVVDVYSGDEVYHYSITSVAVVSPGDVRLLRSDHTARITLITCTKDLKRRLVVVGTLV